MLYGWWYQYSYMEVDSASGGVYYGCMVYGVCMSEWRIPSQSLAVACQSR